MSGPLRQIAMTDFNQKVAAETGIRPLSLKSFIKDFCARIRKAANHVIKNDLKYFNSSDLVSHKVDNKGVIHVDIIPPLDDIQFDLPHITITPEEGGLYRVDTFKTAEDKARGQAHQSRPNRTAIQTLKDFDNWTEQTIFSKGGLMFDGIRFEMGLGYCARRVHLKANVLAPAS